MISPGLGYPRWLWSKKAECIKAQGQAGLLFAQVLQDVLEDFSRCWHRPPEQVLIFLSFRKADVPWRTVGQNWVVYFLYFTSTKIYLQASREWKVEPEVQSELDPCPSQPPALCCSSGLKILGWGSEGKQEEWAFPHHPKAGHLLRSEGTASSASRYVTRTRLRGNWNQIPALPSLVGSWANQLCCEWFHFHSEDSK